MSYNCTMRWRLTFALISLNLVTLGQSNTTAAWFDYNHTQYLKPDLAIVGDVGYRNVFTEDRRQITYIRPGVRYRFNSTFRIQGNVSTFLTFNENSTNTTEFRLAEQGVATWPRLSEFKFNHRLRFEHRYITRESTEGENNRELSEWSNRMRYMLSGTTDYFNLGPLGNSYLTGSIEYFVPLADETAENFSDESRVYIGYGQLLSKGWSYVIHFMWQRSKNEVGDFVSDDFIVRLRIYWKSKI